MATLDNQRARFNMVQQQIRPWDVSDERVLELLTELPREDFVREPFKGLAYADTEIPLGLDQQMLVPRVEARLLQALKPGDGDHVLEIGTGSGFLTACLARMARRVTTIDLHQEFTDIAADRLQALGISNVEFLTGDVFATELPTRSFDVIAVTGGLVELPDSLIRLLKDGGRLFAVLGEEPIMRATLCVRQPDGSLSREVLFDTLLPQLQQPKVEKPFDF